MIDLNKFRLGKYQVRVQEYSVNNSKRGRFTGVDEAVCLFDPDCSFTLNLGTGSGVISAIDGSLLNDRSKNYWTSFVGIG
ncbi:MAG TPA: hypothetical protein VH481_09290 [Nitrososphaeraceae archaeon]